MPRSRAALTATPSTIRRINRSVILNLVRLHEPLSRKELSELSGMFPSNVSAIVDELLEEGLLLEQRTRPLGPGRTPINLFLNPGHLRVLGVNLRADQTTLAWAGLSGRILGSLAFKTPHRPEALVRELKVALETARKRPDGPGGGVLHRVGVSVPGLVEPGGGTVIMTPALPHFKGYPLAVEVARLLGVPALADNDANMTMLGEMWFGERELAGAGDVVLLSVSDLGVGSGLMLNSSLYRGHNQAWAGEFGHMVIDRSGPKCRCGRRGCWEVFISNQATWHRYDATRDFTPQLFQGLIRSALEGEARAVRAFEETAEFLSLGLSNITFALNPSLIIVGGEIAKVWKLIRRVVEGAWRSPSVHSEIVTSRLSLDELHVMGAVALALQDIFAGPQLGVRAQLPRSGKA
jgi:predicted NBD/HSP70 family sugar kinase